MEEASEDLEAVLQAAAEQEENFNIGSNNIRTYVWEQNINSGGKIWQKKDLWVCGLLLRLSLL